MANGWYGGKVISFYTEQRTGRDRKLPALGDRKCRRQKQE
jgi:hypothetical protein